jgi:hypothetical protein
MSQAGPNSLVPAYIWAGDDRRWTRLIASAPHSIVVNPSNGPATRPTPQFRARVAEAVESGATVFGYVAIGWLRTATQTRRAHRDIVQWFNGVDGIAGIFFDEVPTTPTAPIEARLDALLHNELLLDSHRSAILNPGTTIPIDWFDRWPQATVCTFEGSAASYLRSPAPGGPRHRQAALVYGCRGAAGRSDVMRRAAQDGLGWVTATTGRLPNPWDTVAGPHRPAQPS